MQANRRGEKGAVPFRNGRLHCIERHWFFSTRGQRLSGPFRDQDEAESALQDYLRRLS